MGNVEINFDHFMDGYKTVNHEKISKSIAQRMTKFIEKDMCAEIFINGCTYYFKPLTEAVWGFGSAVKELEFNADDNEEAITAKLLAYFNKGYSADVAYGGCTSNREVTAHVQNCVEW